MSTRLPSRAADTEWQLAEWRRATGRAYPGEPVELSLTADLGNGRRVELRGAGAERLSPDVVAAFARTIHGGKPASATRPRPRRRTVVQSPSNPVAERRPSHGPASAGAKLLAQLMPAGATERGTAMSDKKTTRRRRAAAAENPTPTATPAAAPAPAPETPAETAPARISLKGKSGPQLAAEIVAQAGRPMHRKLIVAEVLRLDRTRGKAHRIYNHEKTPDATLSAQLELSNTRGGVFVKTAPGVFALRAWPAATRRKSPMLPDGFKLRAPGMTSAQRRARAAGESGVTS